MNYLNIYHSEYDYSFKDGEVEDYTDSEVFFL